MSTARRQHTSPAGDCKAVSQVEKPRMTISLLELVLFIYTFGKSFVASCNVSTWAFSKSISDAVEMLVAMSFTRCSRLVAVTVIGSIVYGLPGCGSSARPGTAKNKTAIAASMIALCMVAPVGIVFLLKLIFFFITKKQGDG